MTILMSNSVLQDVNINLMFVCLFALFLVSREIFNHLGTPHDEILIRYNKRYWNCL